MLHLHEIVQELLLSGDILCTGTCLGASIFPLANPVVYLYYMSQHSMHKLVLGAWVVLYNGGGQYRRPRKSAAEGHLRE